MNLEESRDSALNYFQFIIFGGTGDLTHRKLIPGFYNLSLRGMLADDFSILAMGRRNENRDEYLAEIYASLQREIDTLEEEVWQSLKKKIHYLKLNFKVDNSFKNLKSYLEELSKDLTINNRIFYLATAPNHFGTIVKKLDKFNIVNLATGQAKLVIEKPFGHDLESAEKLNNQISDVFAEENIYRIDHYLGKEMMQNIMVIRFANAIFEPLWNKDYIDNIQIFSNESGGVVNRGQYYESAGALKDMLQNHMLQIFSLIAMKEPESIDTEAIRDRKVEVMKELADFNRELIADNVVRGQYGFGEVNGESVVGYRDEIGVADDSDTETFIALKLFLDNERWQGVPFYIKTAKRLPSKVTEVIIEFDSLAHPAYMGEYQLASNLLVIKVQPEEGVYLQFNAREPGSEDNIIPVKMDFCQNCQVGINSPEAYERLIYDMIEGDQTLFTRWDEVNYSWQFIDKIAQEWENNEVDFPNYAAGSVGPEEAVKLLEEDGRHWWDISYERGDE